MSVSGGDEPMRKTSEDIGSLRHVGASFKPFLEQNIFCMLILSFLSGKQCTYFVFEMYFTCYFAWQKKKWFHCCFAMVKEDIILNA